MTGRLRRQVLRGLLLLAICAGSLELYFAARIALMSVVDPRSTAFQRSEAWRLATGPRPLAWQQTWVPYDRIAISLKRAVIASEDAGFTEHSGVEWDSLEKAWERNQRAEAAAERRAERDAPARGSGTAGAARAARPVKIVGGSTISQQLAKNLFLGGERSLLRKGQELVLTFLLEALLDKQRILEIYLNSVEWGEGVFGARGRRRALLPRRRRRAARRRRRRAWRSCCRRPSASRSDPARPTSPPARRPSPPAWARSTCRKAAAAGSLEWGDDADRAAPRSPPPPPGSWSRKGSSTGPRSSAPRATCAFAADRPTCPATTTSRTRSGPISGSSTPIRSPGSSPLLRAIAARWMERLAAFRPHLAGAVWRGTATRLSAIHIDLFCDDSKAAELALIDARVDYDVFAGDGPRGRTSDVLNVFERSDALGTVVRIALWVRDYDDLRGALRRDARGRSQRGDLAALRALQESA